MFQKLLLLALVATAMAGDTTDEPMDCMFATNDLDVCDYDDTACAVYVDLAAYAMEDMDGASCDDFCHTQGKSCVMAGNDSGNSCPDQDTLSEDNCSVEREDDYVCECSEEPMEDDCADKFDDVELFCGECAVLVKITAYETCDDYCSEQGRICAGAWEDDKNTCSAAAYEVDCSTDFTDFAGGRSTSDAVCQCHEADYEPEESTEAPVTPEECDNDKCPSNWINDDECDAVCNNAACDYDGGDCGDDDDRDCEGEWGEWSACTGECDDWSMTREYEVSTTAIGKGEECPEEEMEECNTEEIYSCGLPDGETNCGLTHRCVPDAPQAQPCPAWDSYCVYYQQQLQYQQATYNPYTQYQQQFYQQQPAFNPYQQYQQQFQFQQQQPIFNWGQQAGAVTPTTPVQRPVSAQQGLFGQTGFYGNGATQQSAWTMLPGQQNGVIGNGLFTQGTGIQTTNQLRFRSGNKEEVTAVTEDGSGRSADAKQSVQALFNVGAQQQGYYPGVPQQGVPQQGYYPGVQQQGYYPGVQQQGYYQQPYNPYYQQPAPYTPPAQQECSCDDECRNYGDCCYDFQAYCVVARQPQYPGYPGYPGYPYQQQPNYVYGR